MTLSDKSILITGAAGFIGAALGNRLAETGCAVTGLDSYIHPSKMPLKFYCERGDVRWDDLLLMRMKDVDTVIHLAALINVDFSAKMPEYVFDVNLDGTLSVLETARKLDKQVIYASSSEVYGTCQTKRHWGIEHTRASALYSEIKAEKDACPACQDGSGLMDEHHQLDGQSPYAASKIAADRACKAWKDAYGMDVRVLRCFNTYGPYQADDGYGGVIAKFTKQALADKPMTIYGSGEQRRDYLWIEDAVDAYVLALSARQWPGPTNFSTGTTVSILELAQNIAIGTGFANFGRGPKGWYEHVDPRLGEIDCLRGDWSRAKELGWAPKVNFQEGLKRYVEWAKSA